MNERLQKDFIDIMKSKDKKKLDVIKMLRGAIQLEEKVKKEPLTDDEIISIITKQIKMRKDAISDFEKANREDLINSYNEEIEFLSGYLPKQLTMDEVNKIIDAAFEEVKPTSARDMGIIMKEVTPKLKGRTDMGEVSKIIKDKLSSL